MMAEEKYVFEERKRIKFLALPWTFTEVFYFR